MVDWGDMTKSDYENISGEQAKAKLEDYTAQEGDNTEQHDYDFAQRNPITLHTLSLFNYRHLPPHLQSISKPCADLAYALSERLPDGPELTIGLRKLLEAKDAFVRATVVSEGGAPDWGSR